MAKRHAVGKGERVFLDLQVPHAPDSECAIPTNPTRICTLRLFSGFLPNWQNQEAESEFLNGLPLTLVTVAGKVAPIRLLARARGTVDIFEYCSCHEVRFLNQREGKGE